MQCQLTNKFYQKQHDSMYILSYTIFQTILAGIRAEGRGHCQKNIITVQVRGTRNLRVKIFVIYEIYCYF